VEVKSLEKVLCVVVLAMIPAQQIGHAEEPASGGSAAQTLFAYRTSFWARVHDSLLGESELPVDVPVELAPLDPTELEQATINSYVTFRIVRTVVVGQTSRGYGGTLVVAKVTRIRDGKLRMRRGKLEPRVMEVSLPGLLEGSPAPPPDSLKLRLESSLRNRHIRKAKQLAALPLTVPLKTLHIAAMVPEYILLGIACMRGCDL
jgi:hypothetical protein